MFTFRRYGTIYLFSTLSDQKFIFDAMNTNHRNPHLSVKLLVCVCLLRYRIQSLYSAEILLFSADNQGASSLASNSTVRKRVEYIGTPRHSIRQRVEEMWFELSKVSTKDKLADIFTKNFNKPAFIGYLKSFF